MAQFRKKPIVIEASQWFKNGDHPAVNATEMFDYPTGEQACQHCSTTMHFHGWISTLEGGHIVCPGDWIITGIAGEVYPCKPQIFANSYEPVDAALRAIADQREAEESEARIILSNLSSYLGAGIGDDKTTLAQFDDRIRWGIDHIGRVYRNRAAQVVEECSKRPATTWGNVKRAILDDTALPAALEGKTDG